MTTKQLSVFIENKPGRLAEITAVLENERVDIRAMSIADTTNFGILRMIVNEPQKACDKLREAGFTASLTEVITISIKDEPGSLAKALRRLADNGIDVEYVYAFITKTENVANVILRVEDNAKALKVLSEGGIDTISGEDVLKL